MPDTTIFLGASDKLERLLLARTNRHGLVAGATGTGKTVSVQTLVEGLSASGVPVFAVDAKGDLSGLAKPGPAEGWQQNRAAELGQPYQPAGCPIAFFDVFGEHGHPARSSVAEFGPTLLARALDVGRVQEGTLEVAFRVAEAEGLPLVDLADLHAVLADIAERAREVSVRFGHVSPASIGVLQRALLGLAEQGGDQMFGANWLALSDIARTAPDGRGVVSLLHGAKLLARPRLYGAFVLWLLAKVAAELPELGDVERPRLVLVVDEAHMLFRRATPALVESVEQTVRLVRSKGVGVFFASQAPTDLPEGVLRQLGNRIQHAIRAFSPSDLRALRTAAASFRENPAFDTAEALPLLAVGEALVSTLDASGVPTVVGRAKMAAPVSRVGALSDEERADLLARCALAGRFEAEPHYGAAMVLADRAEAVRGDAGPEGAEPEPGPAAPTSLLGALLSAVAPSGGELLARKAGNKPAPARQPRALVGGLLALRKVARWSRPRRSG